MEEGAVEEWSDGSRLEGRAAGGTRTEAMYLGTMATVADAEEVGVTLAWERCDTVALDSQGVIQRIVDLMYLPPRSWIEERLVGQTRERPRRLMGVKGNKVVSLAQAARRAPTRLGTKRRIAGQNGKHGWGPGC